MRAALLEEQNKPLDVVDDLDVGDPGPGFVRVAVKHCGLCHSDLGIIDAENPMPFLPIALGHEAAGVVERVGAGVDGLAPGDKVVLTPAPPCGACYWCVRNEHALCVNSDNILTSTFARRLAPACRAAAAWSTADSAWAASPSRCSPRAPVP